MDREHLVRAAGRVLVVGGLFGAACAIAILAWPPEVSASRFSFPFGPVSFAVAQSLFALQHLTLVAGLLGLIALVWTDAGRLLRTGLVIGVVGTVLLAALELVALVAVGTAETSAVAVAVQDAYGVPTILQGVGLVLAGISLARRPRLPGAVGRWIVLVCGGYVFIPLLPAISGPEVAGRVAIGVWMLCFAAVGVVLARSRTAAQVPAR